MKTWLFITVAFTIIFCSADAQYIYRTTDDGKIIFNKAAPYASACADIPAILFDTLENLAYFKQDLSQYFSKHLDWQKMEAISGAIFIQMIIDSTGKACVKCISHMTYNSAKQIGSLGLDRIVEGMPLWRPASNNGVGVNASTIVVLYCRVAKHKEFEVDYFRTRGVQQVLKYNYKE